MTPAFSAWREGENQNEFFQGFCFNILTSLLRAIWVSGVSFGVILLVLFGLDLIIPFRNMPSFGYALFIWLMLLLPICFFARFPLKQGPSSQGSQKSLGFLLIIALMGLLALFGLSLGKILGILPEDFSLSVLIIIGSIFAYCVYLVSWQESGHTWAINCRNAIPLLIIPLAALLPLVAFQQVDQYDWSIHRYVTAAFGLWLLVMSLYFVVAGRKSRLFVLPASLLLIIPVMMLDSWSVFNLPERSQIKRLETFLLQKEFNRDELSRKSAIVQYLCEFHSCGALYDIELMREILTDAGFDKGDNIRYDRNGYKVIIKALHHRLDSTGRVVRRKTYNAPYNRPYEVENMENFLGFDTATKENNDVSPYFDLSLQKLVVDGEYLDLRTALQWTLESATANNILTKSVFDIEQNGKKYRIFIDQLETEKGDFIVSGKVAY